MKFLKLLKNNKSPVNLNEFEHDEIDGFDDYDESFENFDEYMKNGLLDDKKKEILITSLQEACECGSLVQINIFTNPCEIKDYDMHELHEQYWKNKGWEDKFACDEGTQKLL